MVHDPSLGTTDLGCRDDNADFQRDSTEYKRITQMLIGMLAILLTWIILKMVLGMSIKLLSSIIEHLPVISTFNKQGGMCIGVVKGLLMISIIGLILPILIEIPVISAFHSEIQTSYLGKWLYENNLIIIIYNNLFNIRSE